MTEIDEAISVLQRAMASALGMQVTDRQAAQAWEYIMGLGHVVARISTRAAPPQGCVCPGDATATCRSPMCPRQAPL